MKRSNRRQIRKHDRQRQLRMEPLEHRLCMAASVGWDGPGLGAASISYYIGNVPASVGLDQAEVETAIETALDAWAQVADVTFTQTTLARQSDSLDITFTSIDGSGGVLAQAYLPDDVNRGRLAGDIEFDLADPWEIGNQRGSAAFDLVYVAVHEIGHALGLDHLNVVGSVLRPNVSPSQVFTALSTIDADAILGLYAATSNNATNSGSVDAGGTETTDQGSDTGDESSPTELDTLPRRRGREWRGPFGGLAGWRGRWGRLTAGMLTAAPSHHNTEMASDVNGDKSVTALDALIIMNDLNKSGPRGLGFGEGEAGNSFSMLDVNGDESVSALDALMVINELNGATPVAIAIEVPVGGLATEVEESEEESGNELADETMVDNGPLEEEHEGCRGRRRGPFARFDANEDALLTADEVPENVWKRLLEADEDEDGAISPAELEAIAREHHRRDPFAAFDANEDGALTADEVPERLWDRLSQADADEDGTVTAEELAEARSDLEDHFSHRERRHGRQYRQGCR